MNLLFSRSQMRASFLSLIPLRIGGTVTFKLRAELELSDEELALARKYSFTKATLIASNTAEDLSKAYKPSIFISILISLGAAVLIANSPLGRGVEGILFAVASVPAAGFLSFVVLTVLYFFTLRTHVSVDQLMNGGRMFSCHSVVELDDQEEEILDICKRFYLTLEKAKNWGGREINPLPDGQPFYLDDPEGSERQVAIDRAMHQAGQVTRKLMTPFTVSGQTPQSSGTAPPPKKPAGYQSPTEKLMSNWVGKKPVSGKPSSDTPQTNASKPTTESSTGAQQPQTPQSHQASTSKPTAASSRDSHPFAPKPPDDGSPSF